MVVSWELEVDDLVALWAGVWTSVDSEATVLAVEIDGFLEVGYADASMEKFYHRLQVIGIPASEASMDPERRRFLPLTAIVH